MKKLFTLIFILFSFFAKADYWTQKADFPGHGRLSSFSFSIGNKGYVGGGYDSSMTYLDDFWEYNSATNVWTQKANFGGVERAEASGFSIGNKGYAGCGFSGLVYLQDFWEYDPSTNVWSQKANFGGGIRCGAIGFSINNMGYVGTGYAVTFFNDLWQYNPVNDTWTQKGNLPAIARSHANCFTIGNYAYMLCGWDSNMDELGDVWEYNSSSDTWIQKAYVSYWRADAAAFTIGGLGYFGTGQESWTPYFMKDFWQYNSVTDTWIQKKNVPGPSHSGAAYFSIGNKGYIGLGGKCNLMVFYHDFWRYTPDSASSTGIEEEVSNSNFQFSISPNPAKDFIVINIPGFKNLEYLTIADVTGKKVYETKLLTSDFRLPVSNFQKGIYLVELTNGKDKAVKKFIKD